ncbi:hypothetical protein [Brachybacterium hainanense]|uniref:Abi-like protein n=1 Tax=Brachybacterium hainanense TaxID=1541174 RepID=A0ABV6R797_9MICO
MPPDVPTPPIAYSDLETLLSAPRLAPFLREASGDEARALEYYEWNGRMASEAMVSVAQLEVVVRNAIDRELRTHFREDARGIPWFMLGWMNERQQNGFDQVRSRLRRDERPNRMRDTRDQIIAGQNFGFWDSLLDRAHQELWNACLHHAFPHSGGNRGRVQDALKKVRTFRNRLAHHDSLRQINILAEMERIFAIGGWVSPAAETWMRQATRWDDVHSECPVKNKDVVVVAARTAWELYLSRGFYVCRSGRYFRDVTHMAFYESLSIRRDVAKILWIRDDVAWTLANATRLVESESRDDRQLGGFIAWALSEESGFSWERSDYQVFKLTRVGEEARGHVQLPSDIPHLTSGRGSAFTQGQRYVSMRSLHTARSTTDLVEE